MDLYVAKEVCWAYERSKRKEGRIHDLSVRHPRWYELLKSPTHNRINRKNTCWGRFANRATFKPKDFSQFPILNLYKNTKSGWLKAGLENVLLYGEFPVNIKEVTTPMQHIVWPHDVPPAKFEPYCNYNDNKSENLTKVK